MKKYIKSSEGNYTPHDIYEYLQSIKHPYCTLSDSEILTMADEIYEIAKDEEMLSGEDYESVEDIDIGELIDASDDPFHTMGYNLLGLLDDEDDEEDML